MVGKKSRGERIFDTNVIVIVFILMLLCLLPLVHMVALSFSDRMASTSGAVGFWPVNLTTAAYEMIFKDPQYLRSFWVSFLRVIAGCSINMIVTVLTAYPLSLSKKEFPARNAYMYYTIFTWMFYGGLVAWYLTVNSVGLKGSFWAMVIPSGLPIYNAILVMNNFRNLPKEMREAALMDGANHMTMLVRIYIPLAVPVLATVLLFSMVGHWNDWLQGRLFIDKQEWLPLATYLQSFDFDASNMAKYDISQMDLIDKMSGRNFNAAKVTVAMVPLLVVYPFIQKFFVKGITLGAVKG